MARHLLFGLLLLVCIAITGFAYADGPIEGDTDRDPKKDPDEHDEKDDCDEDTTPFGGTGCKRGRTLKNVEELLDDIVSLLSPILSVVQPSTLSSSTPSPAPASDLSILLSDDLPSPSTTSPLSRDETVACQIYTRYTSFCPPRTVKPYNVTQGTITTAANRSQLSARSDSLRASCLCYSASYFVPEAYDIAASVCSNYTGPNTALQAAASDAASHGGLCERVGNVRCPVTATFGQFAMVQKGDGARVAVQLGLILVPMVVGLGALLL